MNAYFETAEQHGEVCFVARWANVVRNTTARARHPGWTPGARERFANHLPCPSIRYATQPPLPTARMRRVENGEAFSTRYVRATSLTFG